MLELLPITTNYPSQVLMQMLLDVSDGTCLQKSTFVNRYVGAICNYTWDNVI